MCGIVGLFLKDKSLEARLGELLTAMLITMTDRGPDSAGIAIYGDEKSDKTKLVVQSDVPEVAFAGLETALGKVISAKVAMEVKSSHAVLSIPAGTTAAARAAIADIDPSLRLMSRGDTLEIYKEVGLPKNVAERFDLAQMSGTQWLLVQPQFLAS